ncbi:hypothetical protein [Streptomyces sp. NBC_01198]|uniref:hypothetical protein n=1 Tax=Streptomyces sp. NBC_01198 TaxID=2903769 RepID=UPI002E10B573|nr:PQQ-like beta-propeller repeat protein [Streptomyces sp. NBC_01198]
MRSMGRPARRLAAGLAVVAVSLSLVSACESGPAKPSAEPSVSGPQAPSKAPAPPTRTAKPFDPPLKFAAESGVVIPDGLKLLHDRTVYLAPPKDTGLLATSESGELQIIDAGTGKTLNTVRPQPGAGETVVKGMTQAPSLATVGGRTLVLVTFVLDLPGRGTTQGKRVIEMIAVDSVTNRPAWTKRFGDLPDWGRSADPSVAVKLIGVQDGIAVVAADDSYGAPTTYAVDLVKGATGATLWHKADDFHPIMTGTGVVVGTFEGLKQSLAALGLADGKPVWTKYKDEYELGAHYFAPDRLSVNYGGSHNSNLRILDAVSGDKLTELEEWAGSSCVYDDRSVTVCTAPIDNYVIALDAKSAKDLWWLPDSKHTRVAPKVSAVWHGAVYGQTANGPVVVDARTGNDRSTALTVVPGTVDAYVGLVDDEDTDRTLAYPATG